MTYPLHASERTWRDQLCTFLWKTEHASYCSCVEKAGRLVDQGLTVVFSCAPLCHHQHFIYIYQLESKLGDQLHLPVEGSGVLSLLSAVICRCLSSNSSASTGPVITKNWLVNRLIRHMHRSVRHRDFYSSDIPTTSPHRLLIWLTKIKIFIIPCMRLTQFSCSPTPTPCNLDPTRSPVQWDGLSLNL